MVLAPTTDPLPRTGSPLESSCCSRPQARRSTAAWTRVHTGPNDCTRARARATGTERARHGRARARTPREPQRSATTFNSNQSGMAFFLMLCSLANIWFVYIGFQRRKIHTKTYPPKGMASFESALLFMAVMDTPWVLLCTLQCWINTFTDKNEWHQDWGDDGFGCKLMGFYSVFSLVSMMGSNCLVAYYSLHVGSEPEPGSLCAKMQNPSSVVSLFLGVLLPLAVLEACVPFMDGGFHLTNGGFCYADWSNRLQASFILVPTLTFLATGMPTHTHMNVRGNCCILTFGIQTSVDDCYNWRCLTRLWQAFICGSRTTDACTAMRSFLTQLCSLPRGSFGSQQQSTAL